MNAHGPENFSHFWANEKRKEDDPSPQVVQPVEQAAQAKPTEGSCGGSGQGGYWNNQAGRRGRGSYAGKWGDNRSPSLTTGSRSIPGQARGTHEDPRSQNIKPDPYYYIFFEAF